ncbi:MAG: transposase [Phycisphaerales bacterium]|jgi:putative transposase|nr:transposase [Phycisphaerales bacterium]
MTRKRPNFGGLNVHVFNRRVDKQQMFLSDEDYLEFVDLLESARRKVHIELLEWCLMPNHWHLDVEPEGRGDLPRFMELLCGTHAKRWRTRHESLGQGSLYQRAYKAVPVQGGAHLERLIHYIHWNPVKANLCAHPAEWRWGSARRQIDPTVGHMPRLKRLAPPVIEPMCMESMRSVTESMRRCRPLGDPTWTREMAERIGLTHTLRPPRRPPVT